MRKIGICAIAFFLTVLFANSLSASSACEHRYELPSGWSMISLPCQVEDAALEAVDPGSGRGHCPRIPRLESHGLNGPR